LEKEKQEKYQSGVRIILWLMKHSRPDISNAVREASKVIDGATRKHWKYFLRMIKYALEKKEKKLCYTLKKGKVLKMTFQGFFDSDYAGDQDTVGLHQDFKKILRNYKKNSPKFIKNKQQLI
jgi:hypothetical protein